ncbi:MAG: type II TA system antitoxin MqsA family protein [Thermoleophilia bacterium]
MSTTFCTTCMKSIEARVQERRESLLVRGEEVEVSARVAVCPTCGEDVWSNEHDDETLAQAFAEYRRRHRLLQPDEMTRIRKQWGIGQRAFSLLLGWGEITLHRYESGSIQDAAHDAQLRMAERAGNVRILLDSNGSRLTRRQRETIERRLHEVEDRETDAVCEDEDLERILSRKAVGGFGGDVPLSLTKVREAILFFSEMPNMFATKLAKLMFYADFLHYKEHTTSITGLAYAHLPHGPVPERYERIKDDLVENELVHVDEREGDGWAGEVLVAERAPHLDVFTADELSALECVRTQLCSMSSKAVRDLSHRETAYTSTEMGDRIPYQFARELSLDYEP